MSRKGKRRQEEKAKRPVRPKPTFGRYYRHYRETFNKIFLWAGIIAGAVAIVAVVVLLLQHHSVSLTKGDYLKDARKNMALGYFDRAVVSYHQAENADPTDTKIRDEITMARSRADLSQGGPLSRAQGATAQVLVGDSTLAVAHAGLAQLYAVQGNYNQAVAQAYTALRFGQLEGDTAALLAASLVLTSYYRQEDMYDSAVTYGKQAVDLANVVNDPANILMAEVGAGHALLRQGKLEQGKLFFEDIVARAGASNSYFEGAGKVGLADYYQRSGNQDSAKFYAMSVESALSGAGPSEVSAYAMQIHGRSLRDSGAAGEAVSKFTDALGLWQKVRNQASLVDNLNDLARAYYDLKDYFNARKYFTVAAKLATKYGFRQKDLYSADMNLRFLRSLKQDEYLKAGDEGTSLVAQYSVWL